MAKLRNTPPEQMEDIRPFPGWLWDTSIPAPERYNRAREHRGKHARTEWQNGLSALALYFRSAW